MTTSKAIFDTFTIERAYKASATKVFDAFKDPAKKRRWFVEGEGWTIHDYQQDFRVGGVEFSRFQFGDGPELRNECIYMDIVDDRRLVFSYSMSMVSGANGETVPFSVSLGTIELSRSGDRTLLVYTEQTAYLDGKDGSKDRKAGCAELYEALARELGE